MILQFFGDSGAWFCFIGKSFFQIVSYVKTCFLKTNKKETCSGLRGFPSVWLRLWIYGWKFGSWEHWALSHSETEAEEKAEGRKKVCSTVNRKVAKEPYAHKLHVHFSKISYSQIYGVWNSAFVASSQVVWELLVQGTEQRKRTTTHSQSWANLQEWLLNYQIIHFKISSRLMMYLSR